LMNGSMPTLTGPITPDGALVTLAIGVSEVRRQLLQRFHFPVAAVSPVRALLDPGSHYTLADIQALQHLGVTPYEQRPLLSSASGLAINILPVYLLSASLLDTTAKR
jgi:hypothetical protein